MGTMASALVFALAMSAAQASPGGARSLEIQFRVAGDPQVAVWVEDEQGRFVDTLMVTRLTGTFGLANRPGRADFGGGFRWPYGRRENVLPVWAHRRGVDYPRMVFQDCREDSLGWHERFSSVEHFFCRPVTGQEQLNIETAAAEGRMDAVACPTSRFSSDKGMPMSEVDRSESLCEELFERYPSERSLYPPRNDVREVVPGRDWDGLQQAGDWNDLDAVSQATPAAGALHQVRWRMPAALEDGRYTVWVEVNQAFDANEFHDYTFFVDPQLSNYGTRVLGQPSVLWKVPIEVGGDKTRFAATNAHAGYGSVTGLDGTLNPPDGTITTGSEGTGAGRLLPIQGSSEAFVVGVDYMPPGEEPSCEAPAAPTRIEAGPPDWHGVHLQILMPPMLEGARLDINYANGSNAIMDESNFVAAINGASLRPEAGATRDEVYLELGENQAYTVGVRAVSACGEVSDFRTVNVTTPGRVYAEVDACFVATAAHGADYADEVRTLRRFRDEVLMPSDAGLVATELYYFLGPDLADFVRERPALRAATRWALSPLVWYAQNR